MTRRSIGMSNTVIVLIFVILTVLCKPGFTQKVCCQRSLAATPVDMPEGQLKDWGFLFQAVLIDCITTNILNEPDCPTGPVGMDCINIEASRWLDRLTDLIIQAEGGSPPNAEELEQRENLAEIDYLFIGNLTISNFTGPDETEINPETGDTITIGGDLTGDWLFNIQVVDHFHGNVLREANVSWAGLAKNFMGINPKGYYTEEKININLIEDAFEDFLPMGEMFYDYERTPDTCTINPQKDSVEAGETILIYAQGFVDSLQRPSPRFQRILVSAKEGKILNGIEKWGRRVFEIGESGVVEIKYKAPEACDSQTDTLIIENSCYFNKPLDNALPGEEICRQTLRIYDRLPKRCDINPERPTVEAGTAINVEITSVVDNMNKPMQPEERLMVKAGSGKITNGMSHGAYKVFEVGDGTIHARYKAKNDCDILADTIEVYSCCVKGRKNPEYILKERIRKKRIDIKCEYEWTGSLTFTQKSDFNCDVDSTSPPSRTYLIAAESQTQMGAFDIATEKIDLERQGTAMLMPNKMKASGYVNCSKDIMRENGGSNSERGDWGKEKRTTNASEHCQLTEDDLTISITKEVAGMESAVEQLSKEMLEASRAGDVKRAKELKEKMKNAVHGGDDSSNRLSIQVQIGIDCTANAQKTHIFQQYNGIEDEMVKDQSDNSTEEIRIGTPIVLTLDGSYTKSENGAHIITGSFSKSGAIDSGMGIGPIKCPPINSSVDCHFTLTRRRK